MSNQAFILKNIRVLPKTQIGFANNFLHSYGKKYSVDTKNAVSDTHNKYLTSSASELASPGLVSCDPDKHSHLNQIKVLKVAGRKEMVYTAIENKEIVYNSLDASSNNQVDRKMPVSQSQTSFNSLLKNQKVQHLMSKAGPDLSTKLIVMKGLERQKRRMRFEEVVRANQAKRVAAAR